MNNLGEQSVMINNTLIEDETRRVIAEKQSRDYRLMVEMLRATQQQLAENEALIAAQDKKIRELEDLADTDALTGLMNRRGFEKFFARELSRNRRFQSEGGVMVVLDLNGFKQINDRFGHPAGDACLRKVAEYFNTAFRSVDGAARLGGDEFAILLSSTTLEKCTTRILDLKHALQNLSIEWEGETIAFSACIGFNRLNSCQSFDDCYRRADMRLCEKKKQHRAGVETKKLETVLA